MAKKKKQQEERPEWKDQLAELNEEALCADGFESAYIGCTLVQGGYVAVYSRNKCIDILMKRDGMSEEDAEEFFEFNVQGAYGGPFTPLYLNEYPS